MTAPAGEKTGRSMRLKLFVAGPTIRTERAIAQAQRICENNGAGGELIVIDVLEQPDLADQARILATPTLIKESPAPVRRAIGDLSDIGAVAAALGLDCEPSTQPPNGEASS